MLGTMANSNKSPAERRWGANLRDYATDAVTG